MESRAESLLPEQFGPLQGVRILSTGTIVAQPIAAALAAEMGAEVIQIERPGIGDVTRGLGVPIGDVDGSPIGSLWAQDRRNTFFITLDFAAPQGRDLFLRLITGADIWMESSKAGTYAKWGLDDATVLAANPSIVITHVSGYGQTGHPDYLNRASYDPIGQAFGGTMGITGSPDPDPPMTASPLAADYTTAQVCLWSSLAAYIHAQRTGQGQVIDLAQYEAVHKVMSGSMMEYFETGITRERRGNQSGRNQPFGTYQAKDGWVVIAAIGSVFGRVCTVLDLDPTDEQWRQARTVALCLVWQAEKERETRRKKGVIGPSGHDHPNNICLLGRSYRSDPGVPLFPDLGPRYGGRGMPPALAPLPLRKSGGATNKRSTLL